MPQLAPLPELVLGVIWLDQPCTAYHVRKAFRGSLSAYFSGSAGAIYPAIRRLHERRLITSRVVPADARGAAELSITPKGEQHLLRWVNTDPQPSQTIDLDPLRLRVRFLNLLPPKARRTFLDEALAAIEHQAGVVEAAARTARTNGEHVLYLTHRGVLLALRARRTWLREVRHWAVEGG